MGQCATKGAVVGDSPPSDTQVKPLVQHKLSKKSDGVHSPIEITKQDSAFLDRVTPTSGVTLATSPVDDYQNPISAAYSMEDSQEGLAAGFKKFGPPKPACNEARLQNLQDIGALEKPSGDPEIGHIMQLMCTVFNTDAALVALVDDEKIFVHDAINFQKGDFAWRMSFCAHSLTPPNHQTLVIEDAAKDARFAHHPFVTSGKVRFYAGTPMVSSLGHRLGTVCFVSDQPRKFDAEGCNMLNNMGELVVRELERDWALKQHAKHTSANSAAPQLTRAIECFTEPVMFVDVSADGWRILHMNVAAHAKLRLYNLAFTTEEAQQTPFWSLFSPTFTSSTSAPNEPWEAYQEDIAAGRKFEAHGVKFLSKSSANSNSSMPTFSLTFRCAANDVIDEGSALVGSPAMFPMQQTNRQYYFVTLSQAQMNTANSQGSNRSYTSTGVSVDPEIVPFEGLELGPLLGKGGYGRVYRGLINEEIVAVKIIENTEKLRMVDDKPLETVITADFTHPNIVRTLDFLVRSTEGTQSEGDCESESPRHDSARSKNDSARSKHAPKRPADSETWMLLEYCDRGCLQEANDKGWMLKKGKPDMSKILSLAAEVASGMVFLHAHGVAHGDLTGGNVLLQSCEDSPAGLTAKIADFGLARNMQIASRMQTRTYGTVTHMPPELLQKGVFTKAADTFAFGVLLWEMYHGVRAWASMNHAQVITAVAVNGKTLKFPSDAPAGFVSLANDLMSRDPDKRPTFEDALQRIRSL